MLRTLDFNNLPAGTVVDDEYEGVSIFATGGSGKAMIFDSANPTGGDDDLASDTLGGLLIISEDGDSSDPDDNAGGGSLFFDFDDTVQMKSITLKDIEETTGEGTRLIFYDADGNVIQNQFVAPTGDGGEVTLQLFVPGTAKLEVVFPSSGAVDNVTFIEKDPGVIVNEDPDATDDVLVLDEDTTDTVNVLTNDIDPDMDPLTVTAATSPDGTVSFTPDGDVTFTPNADFNGPTTIEYTVEDGNGGSDTGTVNVTVTPVNDAPDAVDDTTDGDEDTDILVDLLANDIDVDGDALTVTAATVPAEQGTLVDNGDGTVTFTPAADFTGPATISYTVEDPEGLSDSAIHTVNVGPVDDDPVAQDDMATTPEDTAVTIPVLDNDSDPDGDLLTITSATSPDGTVDITPDGLRFTPNADFNGPTTIEYTVEDPDGNTDTATVVVDVTPVNDAPDAVDDSDATPFNTPITVDLLDNDIDVDGDAITVISATVPAEQGSLLNNGDGTVTFTPVAGFVGTATISYTIDDPAGLTDSAVHTIDISAGLLDGVVEGTDDGELIDEDFVGDPDGDIVNDDPAILPDTDPDDDSVTAGGGDDTIITGDGSDTIEGGAGDDSIDTGNGDLAPDLGYPTAPTDPLGFDPDSDPSNDLDSVDGGDGNDTISTGDDRDTITGGAGEDVIDGGIDDDLIDGGVDDDRIVGGEGNDTIIAGSGDDTVYAGNDPDLGLDVLEIPDEATPTNPLTPDREPDNGDDSVLGGAGNDVIFGADDDDTLRGGSGDDFLDGQIDDDSLDGGTGEDTLVGGQGDDSLSGGQDNDDLDGGIGDDTLRGNRGDDILVGGDGDDVLDGGGENDDLMGGDGDDTLGGAQGNDTIDGGAGNDIMTGGAGEDLFVNVNAGDDVDGGSGPVDNDTLDLRGSAPENGGLTITYTSADEEDGFVTYFDEDGNPLAETLVFEEIENVIPCFTPGTKIATPKGERLVEDLRVGDRVITRDNGIQDIRWVGARDMSGAELAQAAHLKPVLIRQGALGNDLPEQDMMVSPNHRLLVANDKTALYFEEREVLVAAKHLTGMEGVDIVDVSHTTYIHVMFERHEVILSDGTWTESFQPGDMSLAGVGDAQRQEILELFPELATQEGIEGYASARRSLKKHEAKILTS